ncbi:hypothetical protein EYF80_041209 [Liparis tanakae]|uniref:Uncharacterized protein n=1 Tax=Liparis tanakae TaxID=230148 RepID=A0A4Z2G619_9TELE|nr:hypothetical protein EYF80_041209 [Liparis tanakae]
MMHSSDLEEGRLTTAAHHSHRNKRTEGETNKDNMHTGEVPRGEDTSPNIWNESERSRDGPAQRGPGLKEKRHTEPKFTQKFSRNPAVTYLTRRARRREIKSRETLIALANVTGQEVADKTYNVHAARGSMFQRQCGAYGVKSSTKSSVTLNAR